MHFLFLNTINLSLNISYIYLTNNRRFSKGMSHKLPIVTCLFFSFSSSAENFFSLTVMPIISCIYHWMLYSFWLVLWPKTSRNSYKIISFSFEKYFKSIWVVVSSLIALNMLSERAQVSIVGEKGINFLIIFISLLKKSSINF